MSYLQYPLHSHVLCLRNFSEHFQTYLRKWNGPFKTHFRCDICLKAFDSSTSVYSCEKCEFYIHTSCATSLGRIQHPRHEHPLELELHDSTGFRFDYRCVEFDLGCTFKLGANHVFPDLWVEKYYHSMLQQAGNGESQPQLAHEHPLTSVPVRTASRDCMGCEGCQMQISGEAYGCSECNFFLHEACAKPPLRIQNHHFHPEHPLSLFRDSYLGGCHVCRLVGCIGYRCEKCNIALDMACAIGTMPCEEADEREKIGRRLLVTDHYRHPHRLSSYHAKTQTAIRCVICDDNIISGDFLGCLDCRFFLHESCTQPPAEIEHYLHPEHTLAFTRFPHEKEHRCQCCSDLVNDDYYFYTCRMCDFYLDQNCALQTLSHLEEGVSSTVRHSLHEHELKLCYRFNRYTLDKPCTVCHRAIGRTLGYRCISQECSFQIHRSCSQLPSSLTHPSHLPHPLTLSYIPPHKDTKCRHCCRKFRGPVAFSCGECNFYLHVDCAQMPTLKHPFHEHFLFYFGEIKLVLFEDAKPEVLECSACRKSCKMDLFRCPQCNFNLHYHCSQLLPTITPKHHLDPLVLRESIVEDDSGEYYCDVCERRRDPKKWVYFCETCGLIAHIECALSPVKLEVITEDDFISREEDIKLVQKEIDATEATLMPLMADLKSLRAELESQRAELEELETEHAKWIL